MNYLHFDYGDRIKPEIVITDGIMGSGKTQGFIDTLEAGSKNGQVHKECYLIIVPYLGEVQRYLDKLSALDFMEPVAVDGSKRDDFLKLVQEGRNIITTHALFHLWSESIRDEIAKRQYNIIIDEEITCLKPHALSWLEYQELCKMDYITISEESREIRWDFEKSGEPDAYDGRFKDIMGYCISGSVFVSEEAKGKRVFIVWNLPCDFFYIGKTMQIMTFRFKHSIIRAYLDLHKLEYRIEYVDRKCQLEIHKRATDYIEVLSTPKAIQSSIIGKTALSSGWNKRQSVDTLKAIRTKLSDWLRKTVGATPENLIYTCSKDLSDPSDPKHLCLPCFHNKEVSPEDAELGVTNAGPWLPFNTNGTNNFADKTVVLYMHNVFPNVTLAKFFKDKDVYFDADEYAVSCMVQFIWRAAVRKEAPEVIKLIIPSLRMKKLFEDWRDSEMDFDADAPNYQLLSPIGIITEFQNMSKFCMQNSLQKSNISAVLSGSRQSHKGWRLPLNSTQVF